MVTVYAAPAFGWGLLAVASLIIWIGRYWERWLARRHECCHA